MKTLGPFSNVKGHVLMEHTKHICDHKKQKHELTEETVLTYPGDSESKIQNGGYITSKKEVFSCSFNMNSGRVNISPVGTVVSDQALTSVTRFGTSPIPSVQPHGKLEGNCTFSRLGAQTHFKSVPGRFVATSPLFKDSTSPLVRVCLAYCLLTATLLQSCLNL